MDTVVVEVIALFVRYIGCSIFNQPPLEATASNALLLRGMMTAYARNGRTCYRM